LLLDEPTAALDRDAAARIGATLRELAGAGLAVCLATHDLELAAAVADRRAEPLQVVA
jgi:energy-coupling factor transport system ATP-binding protein